MSGRNESLVYQFLRFTWALQATNAKYAIAFKIVEKHVTMEFAAEPPSLEQEAMFQKMISSPDMSQQLYATLDVKPGLDTWADEVCRAFRNMVSGRDAVLREAAASNVASWGLTFGPASTAVGWMTRMGGACCINLDFYRNVRQCKIFADSQFDSLDPLLYCDELLEQLNGDNVSIASMHEAFSWLFPQTKYVASEAAHYRHPLYPHEIYWMRHDPAVINRVRSAFRIMMAYFGLARSSLDVDRVLDWSDDMSFASSGRRLLHIVGFLESLGQYSLRDEFYTSLRCAYRLNSECARMILMYFPHLFEYEVDEEDESDAEALAMARAAAENPDPIETVESEVGEYDDPDSSTGGGGAMYRDPTTDSLTMEGSTS